MKLRALLILIISIFLSDVQAQLIGDEALRRLENGQATTLEGQFVAYLADSVSPDFIEKQLNEVEICCIEMLLASVSKIHIPSINSSWDDFVMLKRNDNLHLLELWINMLQKNLNTKNNINAKLFFEINK